MKKRIYIKPLTEVYRIRNAKHFMKSGGVTTASVLINDHKTDETIDIGDDINNDTINKNPGNYWGD